MKRVMTALLMVLAIGLSARVQAGYKDGQAQGVPLSSAESLAVWCAIEEIQSVAPVGSKLSDISACLEVQLKRNRICKESNPKKDWSGITGSDGKADWHADRINICDRLLTKTEGAFSILTEVLVHEGVHATQTITKSNPGPLQIHDPVEWEAYRMGKQWLADRLVRHPELTDAQKREIQRHLIHICFKMNEACMQAIPRPERDVKGGHAAGAKESYDGRSNPNIHYSVDVPALNRIEVWHTPGYDSLRTLTSSFAVITAMSVYRLPSGADVLYVFGTNATYSGGGLERFRDLDADGIVDAASRVTILPAGTFGLPHAIAEDDSSHRLYVLDLDVSSTTRIRTLLDNNADTVPEALSGDFASETVTNNLGLAQTMTVVSTRKLYLSSRPPEYSYVDPTDVAFDVVDTDGSGQADLVTSATELERTEPAPAIFVRALQQSDDSVHVYAKPGSLLKIWRTDAAGAVQLELLGSKLTGDPSWQEAIALARPLGLGEYIKVYDVTHGLAEPGTDTVGPHAPEIFSIDSVTVIAGKPVTIRGRNFGSTSSVSCSGTAAPILSQDDHTIRFTAPMVPQDPSGRVMVRVINALGTSGFISLLIDGDCNGNGIADRIDIVSGLTPDVDDDNVPDACGTVGVGRPEARFISLSTSPNPFSDGIDVKFTLAAEADVSITICDLEGRQVAVLAAGRFIAGVHRTNWMGRSGGKRMRAGIYLVRVVAAGRVEVAKIALIP